MKIALFFFSLAILVACDVKNELIEGEANIEQTNYYKEAHRPQYHFSPSTQWMNDPNGMVYLDGEYHLFYQHYPDSNIWGPMHWGHAISEDLVHWQHLPIALYPDSLGYIFSGSAVVDQQNTSGLGKDGQPPLIAIFTHHDMEGAEAGRNDVQYQSIAYSNDKGRTWTKYANNPVLPNTEKIRDFRDPKVFWHEKTARWIMILAANDRIKLYTSPNLLDWTFASDFGMDMGSQARPWECPDLFSLTTQNGVEKWVMLVSTGNALIEKGKEGPNGGSAIQYFIGDFDGQVFILDENLKEEVANGKALWIDYGRDNYAGVTWANVPRSDGRRLFMGWMSNWDYAQIVPTTVWRNAMTLPRTLSLRETERGMRVFSNPIEELKKLRTNELIINNLNDDLSTINPERLEVILEMERPEGVFAIELHNSKNELYRMGYDGEKNQFFSDRTKAGSNGFSTNFAEAPHPAPRLLTDETLKFHLFFDRSSVELFADDGSVVLTDIFFPTETFTAIKLITDEDLRLENGMLYELKKAVPIQ